jgi:glycosyltransferase involved in cell wall biosynthesis
LIRALQRRGLDTRVFAPIPADQIGELKDFSVPLESYYTRWYGAVPRLRSLFFRIESVLPALLTADAILCAHLGFFPECVLAKMLRPELPFIHYCPELWTREEYGQTLSFRFYAHFGYIPDLIIDANACRATARLRLLGLRRTPCVLPNTLPAGDLPPPAPVGELARIASLDETSRPWLVYAGNLSWSHRIDILLGAMKVARKAFTLVLFANAPEESAKAVQGEIDRYGLAGRVRLLPGRPWKEVMGLMAQADAGLMYYPESAEPTLNVRYCAPTKVFEYLALGLPVVSTGNPTMQELLVKDGLGACARDDSPAALAEALDTVFGSFGIRPRVALQTYFREHLSFEVAAEPVLGEIEDLIASARGDR